MRRSSEIALTPGDLEKFFVPPSLLFRFGAGIALREIADRIEQDPDVNPRVMFKRGRWVVAVGGDEQQVLAVANQTPGSGFAFEIPDHDPARLGLQFGVDDQEIARQVEMGNMVPMNIMGGV